jgi:hypothetical protein
MKTTYDHKERNSRMDKMKPKYGIVEFNVRTDTLGYNDQDDYEFMVITDYSYKKILAHIELHIYDFDYIFYGPVTEFDCKINYFQLQRLLFK